MRLIERGVLAITDVPEDLRLELSDKQGNQLRAAQKQREVVDHVVIGELLLDYEFPLSFFDYETYAAVCRASQGTGRLIKSHSSFPLTSSQAPTPRSRITSFCSLRLDALMPTLSTLCVGRCRAWIDRELEQKF